MLFIEAEASARVVESAACQVLSANLNMRWTAAGWSVLIQ
jgi:hypothetical protein